MRKVLVLTGAASLAVMLWLSVPLVVSCLPSVWRCFVSWLQPPYVYVLLNGIIVTIAASSKLSSRGRETEPTTPRTTYRDNFISDPIRDLNETSEGVCACECDAGNGVGEDEGRKEEKVHEFEVSRSIWTPSPRVKREEAENVPPEGGQGGSSPAENVPPEGGQGGSSPTEKPLVSSRLSHRRPVKLCSLEGGKVLGVTKPRRQETLENTWKSIMEGRPMPLTKHLKKCDTSLENRGRPTMTSPPDPKAVKKSATFRDRTNEMPTTEDTTAPRKEAAAASLSRDELNRRVEAFIQKFNEEMRLQRQESLDQYRAMMVSRRI